MTPPASSERLVRTSPRKPLRDSVQRLVGGEAKSHQQPDVNYIQVLEKFDFPCTVHAQRVPFKGNQLRAETG